MKDKVFVQGLMLSLLTLFLSAVTLALGAIPMYGFYLRFGKKWFAIAMGGLALGCAVAGVLPLAFTIATVSLLLFLFKEFEHRGWSLLSSGLWATSATAVAVYSGAYFWLQSAGKGFSEFVRGPIETFVNQLNSVNASKVPIVANDLIVQIPSGVLIFLIAALSLAVLFEARLAQIFRVRVEQPRIIQLLTFRLPDLFVWLLLASLVAAFYQTPLLPEQVRWVGSNFLNVLVLLYFFQGLAIVAAFFRFYKVSPLWRSIWYVFIVLQLFLLVSCIGFVDYWLDFRLRMQKKTAAASKVKDKGGWT